MKLGRLPPGLRPLHRDAFEIIDPDLSDPRLATARSTPTAWADDDVLTIAVDGYPEAPYLIGTFSARLRPAGAGRWALRIRVTQLDRACVEYGVLGADPADASPGQGHSIWRGRLAGPAAAGHEGAPGAPLAPLESQVIAASQIAAAHPVKFWCASDPMALIVCADGDGLEAWVGLVAASGVPVALAGVASAGRALKPHELVEIASDRGRDRRWEPDARARAYLPNVDPAYFAAHLTYVRETVVPWAEDRIGLLPRIVFGHSNGAAWATAAAALHPGDFEAVLAFSLGVSPSPPAAGGAPRHALVAGRLEPNFHRETCSYARKLRRRGVSVRLRTPVRGHDFSMWRDEFLAALEWALWFGR